MRLGFRKRSGLRSTMGYSFAQWAKDLIAGFGGRWYGLGLNQTLVGNTERTAPGFGGYVAAYRGNGIVFSCMGLRLRVFSEARFQFRQRRSGRPGDLFGTEELLPLEEPWPNGTTGDLLARAIQDADLAGNFYPVRIGDQIKRLRPDLVTIVMGVPSDATLPVWDARSEVLGYLYTPNGPSSPDEPIFYPVEQVAHFAPIPDPLSPWKGMSWLTPILREIDGDNAASEHKLRFFENGATPNLILTGVPGETIDKFREWVEAFGKDHEGLEKAYKTIFLSGGADGKVVGSSLRQIDFKVTQGAGETRIAAAAGTPPVLVGLSEGLQAATYSNYGQARRAFADETMRPTWRNFAGSIARIIRVPENAELWYDDRDIPFLAEDVKDTATIRDLEATTIRRLLDAGFTAESVVAAVKSGDWNRLEHTGLFSVQLQPPQTTIPNSWSPAATASWYPLGQGGNA